MFICLYGIVCCVGIGVELFVNLWDGCCCCVKEVIVYVVVFELLIGCYVIGLIGGIMIIEIVWVLYYCYDLIFIINFVSIVFEVVS